MNILQLIIKEIKHNVRDKKGMAMMILFPILLILVLGNALKDSSYDDNSIGKSKVLYSIQSTGMAAKDLKENIIDKGKDFNIDFTEATDIEAAKKQIKDRNEYDSLIIMKDDSTIEVYKNSRYDLLSGLSESILNTYVQRYNTIAEIAKVNPLKLQEILFDTNIGYTNIVSLNKAKTPRSIDYYTITMITLIIMYGTSVSLFGISGERHARTRDRILSAPVKKHEFLIGKTLGSVLIIMFQMSIVILFTKYVLNAYWGWGNDIIPVLLVIVSQIIMVVGIGTSFGFLFKNENAAYGILNVIIPILEFLGGAYFSVDGISSRFFQILKGLSPVAWTNKAIFSVIYSSDLSKVLPAIIINISIAVVCIAASSIKFRKEIA